MTDPTKPQPDSTPEQSASNPGEARSASYQNFAIATSLVAARLGALLGELAQRHEDGTVVFTSPLYGTFVLMQSEGGEPYVLEAQHAYEPKLRLEVDSEGLRPTDELRLIVHRGLDPRRASERAAAAIREDPEACRLLMMATVRLMMQDVLPRVIARLAQIDTPQSKSAFDRLKPFRRSAAKRRLSRFNR